MAKHWFIEELKKLQDAPISEPERRPVDALARTMNGHPTAMPADLNLLRVFLAISDLHSLTAAGERLGLTQSAVSHALRRLREQFDDPLFVRTPDGMTPTEAARQLQVPLTQAFGIIHVAVQRLAQFDPSTANRVFRVSMSDMAEFYFLPPLLARLAEVAPAIKLEVTSVAVDALCTAMRGGAIDLALGYVPDLGPGCVSQTLFSDEHACMVRAGHPLHKRAPSREDLAALRYVYASSNATGHRMVEKWLDELHFTRTIVLRLPHFIVAPEIIQHTDLAIIFPRSIAGRFNRGRSFRILPLPFALPRIEVQLHSHVQFAADPGVAWLRGLIHDLFYRPDASSFPMTGTGR